MFIDTDILREHADEVAFLWRLRQTIVRSANQRLVHLAEHDKRIEAHLDGLRLAGAIGWEIAHGLLLESPEGGAAFTAAALASEPDASPTWLGLLHTAVIADAALVDGVAAGLTWIDPTRGRKLVAPWDKEEHPTLRMVVVAVAAVGGGGDVSDLLRETCSATDVHLRGAALRAIGSLGCRDLLPTCQRAQQDPDPAGRAAALWSSVILGGRGSSTLRTHAERGGRWGEDLTILAAHRLVRAAVMEWVNGHKDQPENLRRSIILAGHHGDTVVVPWLLKRMLVPGLARSAAAAFSLITGLDLEETGLTAKPPTGFQAGPTDDPADADVALDPDEYLPWPDVPRITAWWEGERASMPENVRFLLGRPMTTEHLDHVLRTGTQPQRRAAAIERAVQNGGPLFDVDAPAEQQEKALPPLPSVTTATSK